MDKLSPSTEKNVETFNSYYSKPAWWFRWRYDTQIKRKTIFALLKRQKTDWSGSVIFDLGFGSGDVLFSFPEDCEIYGLELSPSAIKQALNRAEKKGYAKFGFFEAQNNTSIPLNSDFADVVIASHVLEHVDDDMACLQELYRILKMGGCLTVLIPINEHYQDLNHLRKYDFESFKKLCEQCNFHFVYGFENEYLFYFVEKLYWKYQEGKWDALPNFFRIFFNLLTAPLPYFLYRLSDVFFKIFTSLPPRQAALLFVK